MGIYTYPTGVVENLRTGKNALFNASVYITGEVECVTSALFDASVNIGDSSADFLRFYQATLGATQAAMLSDVSDVADATQPAIVLQAVLDLFEAVGLVATS